MKKEAIRRMKMLGLNDKIIEKFEKDNIITCSYQQSDFEPYVKEFQDSHPSDLVYHVIESPTSFGRILNILFVSKYREDWDYELQMENMKGTNLKVYYPMVYARNITDDMLSDLGTIGVLNINGNLVRIS